MKRLVENIKDFEHNIIGWADQYGTIGVFESGLLQMSTEVTCKNVMIACDDVDEDEMLLKSVCIGITNVTFFEDGTKRYVFLYNKNTDSYMIMSNVGGVRDSAYLAYITHPDGQETIIHTTLIFDPVRKILWTFGTLSGFIMCDKLGNAETDPDVEAISVMGPHTELIFTNGEYIDTNKEEIGWLFMQDRTGETTDPITVIGNDLYRHQHSDACVVQINDHQPQDGIQPGVGIILGSSIENSEVVQHLDSVTSCEYDYDDDDEECSTRTSYQLEIKDSNGEPEYMILDRSEDGRDFTISF